MDAQRLLELQMVQGKRAKGTIKLYRRFLATAPLSQVVAFIREVTRKQNTSKSFEIITPFPRQVIYSTNIGESKTYSKSLVDLKITNKSVLYVHPVDLV